MKLPVTISDRAFGELNAAYEWWAKNRSADQALDWYNGFIALIKTLNDNPTQWPLALENDEFPFELRQRNYGSERRLTHRAVFTVRPDMIFVLRIRHLAQDKISPDD